MQTFGPFFIDPLGTGANPYGTQAHLNIPVLSSTEGLIEIINYSIYPVRVDFQSQGSVTQEDRSKCIYHLVSGAFGPQTIQISPFNQFIDPESGSLALPTGPLFTAQGINSNVIIINVYQIGEIEWYPPLSLGQALLQGQTSIQTTGVAGTGALVLTLPTATALYGKRLCWLTGIDYTYSGASTAQTGTLVASLGGIGKLNWFVEATTTQTSQLYQLRPPAPAPNDTINPWVITSPALASLVFACMNAYFFLD